jgi:hypothetical protein
MATLTSESTEAEVWAAYDDNASYEEDGSVTKANAFITACRILSRRRPTQIGRGDRSTTLESLRQEIADARAWIAAHPVSTGANARTSATFADFRNFRG